MVSLTCPSCGKPLQAADSHLGRQVKCDQCGATFTLKLALDGTAGHPPHPGTSKPAGVVADEESSPARTSLPDDPTLTQEPLPKTIGHYVVLRKLGAGNMGVVWLAHDPNLDRDVAIKVLPAGKNEMYRKRFLREARLAAKLHHQNAVTVFDAGADGDLAYIVMELVEGGSLDQSILPDGLMDWRQATRAVRDAAAGLAAAHELGLIHRDVKPANLMRTKAGMTKVADFGLARSEVAETRYTQQGMLMGTPVYMAPELWSGAEADARSDIYSLVLTYYYLLTGRVAFNASDFAALGYQHKHEPLPDPRDAVANLPDGVCRILLRGSAKEPAARYASAAELVAELDVLLTAPQRSLASGTSWEKLGGSPASKPLSAKTAKKPDHRTAAGGRRLRWWLPVLTLALAAAAVCLLAAIIYVATYVATNHGYVKIELSEPAAKVEVKVDGRSIEITRLREPLQIKQGDHELEVTSEEFKTCSKSFTVARGATEVVRVTLERKPKPVDSERSTPALEPQPNHVNARSITNSLGAVFLYCPPGSFTMGSPGDEKDRFENEAQVSVTISKGFYLGKYSVRQGEFKVVMGTTPWVGEESVKRGDDYPATYVDWNDAAEFCRKLTARESQAGCLLPGYVYALPTEAQREYACRAGTTTAYSFGGDGNDLGDYGWYDKNANDAEEKYAHWLGQKKANPWGFYDVHGNVWEWCRDYYAKKLPGGTDPLVETGADRVRRGGGWGSTAGSCRSASRRGDGPSFRSGVLGFRVALVPADK